MKRSAEILTLRNLDVKSFVTRIDNQKALRGGILYGPPGAGKT